MTNKEAIANLNHIYGVVSPDIQRSLDVAFKCMEERPQGEWIDHSETDGYVECPFCGSLTTCESNKAVDELHYCFNCGAELGKGGAE